MDRFLCECITLFDGQYNSNFVPFQSCLLFVGPLCSVSNEEKKIRRDESTRKASAA